MKDGRANVVEYTTVIRHFASCPEPHLVVQACRTMYAQARFLLLDNIKMVSQIPYLLELIPKFY